MKNDDSVSKLIQKHRKELIERPREGLKDRTLNAMFPSHVKESKPFLSWLTMGGGAVAAGLALMMAFQLGQISGHRGDQIAVEEVVSAHVRSLMVQHLSDVVSTDQHTVKPWFEGKIDFGPTVRDFADRGFPLIGGRLDYIADRPTAALVYKSNQHVINVFEQPSMRGETSSPHLRILRGFQVFSWSRDGIDYWAVSDLNASDLQKFSELWLDPGT